MICFPNAKINLGLYIIDKRSDGYHNIETIMYPINFLFDSLEISKDSHYNLQIHNNASLQNCECVNICTKALTLIKDICYVPELKISLIKNIPVGGGLGGGSSDAAFLLKTLISNKIIDISKPNIYKILNKLGSDCLFFYYNRPMFAKQTGNNLKPVNIDLSSYQILVVDSKIHVSTSWAYNNVKINSRNINLIKIIESPIEDWKHILYNDFEAVVLKYYPLLSEIKEYLYKLGAIYVSLTGTGGCIYAIFDKDNKYYSKLKQNNNLRFFIGNA